MHRALLPVLLLVASASFAGPYIPAGDLVLRHDIQRLADHNIIKGTTSTWPLAWGPILDDLSDADATSLPPGIADALARVQQRASWETRTQELTFNTKVGVADNATRIRSFQYTPRGKVEVGAGMGWIDDWFSIDLNVQGVDSDQDSDEFRADDSMIGVVIGNWSIAASTQQRWWGPGWDGSLILSNNARPFPALTFDRVFTDAFKTKWLSWIGPWDLSVMFGQLEKERAVPNAQFFGMRFNFRPVPSLEIGISRTAQWCGDGRPCDASTFVDLFFGRDNIGDAGIGAENEPGNQMAGLDFRWSNDWFGTPMAFYGQFTAEDEAGGFPSRYLAQGGVEVSSWSAQRRWSYRWYAELAGTSCDFLKDDLFNCAYNHGIYQTGYRYRGRAVGHGADNDALIGSLGLIVVTENSHQFSALLRAGDLNRGGAADPRNTLTAIPLDLVSADLSYARPIGNSRIELGVGYEQFEDPASSVKIDASRAFLQWHSGY